MDYKIRKNEVFGLQNSKKSEFVKNSNFHPITKENMNPNFKIRIAQGHFWKIYRVREKAIGWKK